jgi:hypothetical protein
MSLTKPEEELDSELEKTLVVLLLIHAICI